MVVKTVLGAATERKYRKAEKTVSNYAARERHRKAKRMQKEKKPLLTLKITTFGILSAYRRHLVGAQFDAVFLSTLRQLFG